MRNLLLCLGFLFLLLSCEGRPSSAPKEPPAGPPPKVVVEKEKVEKIEPLPPEVKIRLKRDGKENYSWEITGSDVNEILKINERLKKSLGGESQR
ncbi:MAG: hypothetical protein N3G78_01955 [Desulfobacterota bacterium]|nr:hypothetical protein [Thermodesulfobacteriota bacterium]